MRSLIRIVASTAAALVTTFAILTLVDAPPLEVVERILDGAVGSRARTANTLLVFSTIAVAVAGLRLTFAAGLWNIGVEGQMVAGAIAASYIARNLSASGALVVTAAVIAGLIGGAIWGALAGMLKAFGGVNEIFAGLGLNFVAAAVTIYLIIGPWQREGVASTSGTDLFPERAWFPTVGHTQWSILAFAVAAAALLATYFLLQRTPTGLRLRALGNGPRAAWRLGVNPTTHTISALTLSGMIAGLAGTIQVLAFHHKLVPSLTGGYGFTGILVLLIAANRAWTIVPLTIFFAATTSGSSQLKLRLDLDASLAGVFQGIFVVVVLVAAGIRERSKRTGRTSGNETRRGATLAETSLESAT